jgi:hypothetical protein
MTAPTVDDVIATLPEGTRVTTFNTVLIRCPLKAGTCTPENCVNLNDPVAQASCSLC